jgi:toluene monooxygenase system protein B
MDALPLSCSFEDGCILTLVVVDRAGTMDDVARTVAEHFVGRMLPAKPGRIMRVRLQGETEFLPRELRVSDAGWVPMTTIQIAYEPQAAAQSQ